MPKDMNGIGLEENIAVVQRNENGELINENSGSIGLDGYEIGKLIGKGQYSSVYIGRRRDTTQQIVAIKRVEIFELKEKTRKKCLREVRLLQSLDHPHIIKCFDAFIQDNELIIILEWAERGDLRRLIRKAAKEGKQFAEKDVWAWSYQICHAIQHMHERRIMHRDIKPANIFVNASGVLKLGDLGLGRHFSFESVQAFSKVGTPLYMSPDVLEGGGYDWKSDVWSVGVLLYELATLKSPFMDESSNLYEIYRKIQKGSYEPLPDSLSLPLREIINSMLQVDPNARPDMKTVCDMILRVVSPPDKNLPAEEELEEEVDLFFEITLDKLKLLNYEVLFCIPRRLRPIHGLYFLAPQDDHHSQFMYFAHLISWLMTLCNYPAPQPDVFGDPATISNELLADVRQLGVQLDYPPSRIRIGYGYAVCDMLDRVCDLAIGFNQIEVYLPNHFPDVYPDEDDIETVMDEAEVLIQPENVIHTGPDGHHDDGSLGDDIGGDSNAASSANMIISTIDPKLWNAEVQRVTANLKVVVKDNMRWEYRLETCHQVEKIFADHTPLVKDGFDGVGKQIGRDFAVVSQREETVNQKFTHLRKDYQENATKFQETTRLYENSSQKLTALSSTLSQIQSEVDSVKNATETKSQEIADGTPLKRMQEAMKSIKGEVKKMDIHIGTQLAFLSGHQSRSKEKWKPRTKKEDDGFDSDFD